MAEDPHLFIYLLLLEKLEKIPQKDVKIRVKNVEFTIEKVEGNRINKVKVERL